MTTRSERRYQTVKDSSMEEILQTLLEDCRQREEQFAEERRLRELELRRREEERLHRDEEAARKEREMQEQRMY